MEAALFFIVFAVGLVFLFLVLNRDRSPQNSHSLQRRQTQVGEFRMSDPEDGWECFIEHQEGELLITASDHQGEPNPEFVLRLPSILLDLPKHEKLARAKEGISKDHVLYTVHDSDRGDFELGFDRDNDDGGETVLVTYENGTITDTVVVD